MFWEGFYKRASTVSAARGTFSRGRHVPPPLPGPHPIASSPRTLPSDNAMVLGDKGLKKAPQAIKGKGVGSMAIP